MVDLDNLDERQRAELQEIANAVESNERRLESLKQYANTHAMANHNINQMMGQGQQMGGGLSGGLNGGFSPILKNPSPATMPYPPMGTEDMLRDLIRRAARKASDVPDYATASTIDEHRAMVRKLLEDFEDGASYLQAQIPVVEAAFKDKPSLAHRLVQCINRAYTELCAETFGDGK